LRALSYARSREHPRSGVFAALILLQALTFLNSWRRYRQLPELPMMGELEGMDGSEMVSIVIPARNEATRLPSLLASLDRLDPPIPSVLVVDDASTDGTGELVSAAGYASIRLEQPPDGWTGKNWACWNGALHTSGAWIAFVDADVELEPLAIRTAMAEARRSGAALFSAFLQQKCLTFWERLLLPYAFCLYFAGSGGRRANADVSHALANGQFLLARREDYLAVGGHEAIHASPIDDVALARRFLECGKGVAIRRSERLGRVRMYDGLQTIRAGFAKNAVQFSAASSGGWITVLGSMVGFSLAWRLLRSPSVPAAAGAGLSAVAISRWYSHFGVPRRYSVLHPLAATVFQLIAMEAVVRQVLGTSTWKGRRLP
jgi:4,4'-diaponeurosporenoate glycosyltransferase